MAETIDPEAVVLKNLVIVSAVLTLLVAGNLRGQTSSNAPPAGHRVSPEASNHSNPVKPSPESLAAGKKIYGYDCAMCHGKDGDGKGEIKDVKGIPDFTDPAALRDRTDGDLFRTIQKGKGDMPPEGDRANTENLWNLVNYVRSLAKKK